MAMQHALHISDLSLARSGMPKQHLFTAFDEHREKTITITNHANKNRMNDWQVKPHAHLKPSTCLAHMFSKLHANGYDLEHHAEAGLLNLGRDIKAHGVRPIP